MTLIGVATQTWSSLPWSALPDMMSWPGLLIGIGAPLMLWVGRCVRDWQEHLKVRMILRNAPKGSVIASQTRDSRSVSTLVIWIGVGEPVVRTAGLPDQRRRDRE